MNKPLLYLCILVTICNLTIGIAYSAVCQAANGGRSCGEFCGAMPDGGCVCKGSCTADEMKWVDGAHGDEELL